MKLNKQYFKDLWKVLVCSANAFVSDKALKMSASLAYSTIFSLSPLLVIVISLATLFYEREAIQGTLFKEINGLVGNDAALQIQQLIEKSSIGGGSVISLTISIFVLILGATAIFTEIQDSLNTIWRVRPKPKKGFQKFLLNRVLSFSMIIGLGFLLIASLLINGAVAFISERLSHYLPHTTAVLVLVFNVVLTFTIVSTLFAIIFKFLPDVKIAWKNVRTGAIATALLFMLGRYIIGLYLTTTGTGSTFGAAGSVIVILTWVYYTAAILYFGAEFTQVYAEKFGGKIEPAEYAVYVQQIEKEKDVAVLPLQNPDIKKDD
ncbi:YihY/virulence factor BrkB family protein [Hufsiella ginkgonis]|uniref:YihY family inner membrane protein n=1 Tax=Hufsiella ginkgonis TaxID=2695274 RepID=A0A7K1XTU9_9SPHI|nr:YihY/virulence factor BrkB family protein [Hufsiella ginkgonis]MXV14238.1 YihY family inner membrane protein [Hufsiella ginkgonis]